MHLWQYIAVKCGGARHAAAAAETLGQAPNPQHAPENTYNLSNSKHCLAGVAGERKGCPSTTSTRHTSRCHQAQQPGREQVVTADAAAGCHAMPANAAAGRHVDASLNWHIPQHTPKIVHALLCELVAEKLTKHCVQHINR